MNDAPRLAFARLADPPAAGTIQFYDNYVPALLPGAYTVTVTHAITPPQGQPAPTPYSIPQPVAVQAPQFAIDDVETVYPPEGSTDNYDQQLPFLVLGDASLLWERTIVPGAEPSNPPTPWVALVLFAEGEIYMQPGSNDPIATCTVQDLLSANPCVLKPQLTDVPGAESGSGWCQTITIPGSTFAAVMPALSDLPYLAHCRAVNTADEDSELVAVVIANRIPRPNVAVSPAAPCRYYAHLVSLEGFGDYLGPNASPLPSKPGGTSPVDVQMVSLAAWTFVSVPGSAAGFAELVTGLIASETPAAALALPALPASTPASVASRLQDGYVPVSFMTESGDETLAWYRGPFTATVPQPLPAVGNPAVPVVQATSADALWIYLAEQGLFDLSYAAAWNVGRALALADAAFAEAVHHLGRAGREALGTLSQRLAMPHFAPDADAASLLTPGASHRQLARLVGSGLGERWTGAMRSVREGVTPSPLGVRRAHRRAAPHPRDLLARPDVRDAVANQLADAVPTIASWLANLTLLYPVPFAHLVPDGRMMPVESIRFFYVDAGWLDALTAGAMSLAAKTGADQAVASIARPAIDAATARARADRFVRPRAGDTADVPATALPAAGLLIRSALVSSWPGFAIAATAGGAPVNIVRDDCPSRDVRLCLFDRVPDTITVAEPYHSLRFGIDSGGIAPRNVTTAGQAGAQMPGVPAVPPGGYATFLTMYCPSANGVLTVAALASALASATGAGASFGAGDFAMQLVQAPGQQTFASS